jgi:hypothetical protein
LISHPLDGMLDSADFHSSGGGGGVCCGSSGGGELRQRQRWQLRLARQCAVNEAHSVISADTQIAHVADRLRRSATYQNLPCKLPNAVYVFASILSRSGGGFGGGFVECRAARPHAPQQSI